MGEIKAARYSHQRRIFYDGFYVLAKSGSLARGGGLSIRMRRMKIRKINQPANLLPSDRCRSRKSLHYGMM